MKAEGIRSRFCIVHRRPVCAEVSPAALADLISRKTGPAIVGGNDSVKESSVFCAEPLEQFTFHLGQSDPFAQIERTLSKYRLKIKAPDPFNSEINRSSSELKVSDTFNLKGTFGGGWIGYFGYELGRFIERLPVRAVEDIGLPVIYLAFYDKAILYDPAAGQYWLTVLEIEGESANAGEKFRTLEEWLYQAAEVRVPKMRRGDLRAADTENFSCRMSRREYWDALEKIRRHIDDGDVYQINFSRRFECAFPGRPIDLFHWQNTFNPSPCAAYLAAEDWAIVSASPELFLRIEGDRICTRPIKGTRPRASGPDADQINRANFTGLVESEKEQAELAMIVDLERNDLARVCLPGTRHVSRPREIEEFATVYHAVATIEGILPRVPDPRLFCEILKATFPGGSITGAPKIRAMEIIDALEPTARGVYTGSIGWIGIDGSAWLNIAIRTIVLKDGRAIVQTGGGIVADSDPQAEWEEMLTKAAALLEGITAVQPVWAG